MARIYYIQQATSLYKGLSIASGLMGVLLVFIGFMAYRQDGKGMSLIEYAQNQSILFFLMSIIITLLFLGAWYLNKISVGNYRVDEEAVHYKDAKTHSVIKWNEIEFMEYDGYGTVLFHGASKQFQFSMLAVQQSLNNSTNKEVSIANSLSSLLGYIGIGKRKELSPYATEVMEFITKKMESLQLEAKFNVHCGFKRNKNVQATNEIF